MQLFDACNNFRVHLMAEIKDWKDILRDIREALALHQLWENYTKRNSYASALTFSEVLNTAKEITAPSAE